MMKTVKTYDAMRNDFMEAVRASMKSDIGPIQKVFDSLQELDGDKRTALDQGFRDYLLLLLGKPQETQVWERFLSLCVEACRREMATVTMPVVLLGDIFDCLTLDRCEQLFTFVENGVTIWKEELFFTACKNNLLRMCNDLLRRLSRSQNTVFCGRILLFLAKFFPFSERSGLNIVSEFNIDNITEFSNDDAVDTKETVEKMDESMDEGNTDKIRIDYSLYSKFWALQNFFRNPLLVYNKVQWKTFTSHTESVTSAFKSWKLEGVQNKKLVTAEQMVTESMGREHYFAKFLTNQKLLELQLSDINFRRYVLVQFLILFQYLNATVKFKNENQELKLNEVEWVKDTTEQVYSLLRETPPDGETFAKTVQHILKREESWNNWKNEGCPELHKPATPAEEAIEDDKRQNSKIPKRPKKRIGTIIKEAQAQKKFMMGNPELTRLWNYMPDNLEACRAPERNFLMSLEDYFKDAIEQLDPAAMVEDQYKVVNDGNFGWRALRLLALQSSHFFTHSNNPINKLPEYLEAMIKKIAKERPIMLPSGEKQEPPLDVAESNTVLVNETEAMAEEEDELLKPDEKRDEMSTEEQPETPEANQNAPGIAAHILDAVAKNIDAQWRELAEKMGFTDTIQYIEGSLQSDLERARYVVQLWAEDDLDNSAEQLAKSLEDHGFPKAAAVVKQSL
uniref:Death domain-containing protein n=1 Tax=Cuerna arida TaxID=1464854 RepID=A0A1B6EI84_9HEMI